MNRPGAFQRFPEKPTGKLESAEMLGFRERLLIFLGLSSGFSESFPLNYRTGCTNSHITELSSFPEKGSLESWKARKC
jgi:hypothetical protein